MDPFHDQDVIFPQPHRPALPFTAAFGKVKEGIGISFAGQQSFTVSLSSGRVQRLQALQIA